MSSQDPKVMGLQPSELETDGLRRSLAELGKKIASLEAENDDLMREVCAARNQRQAIRMLFIDLNRVLMTYREVPDREPGEGGKPGGAA